MLFLALCESFFLSAWPLGNSHISFCLSANKCLLASGCTLSCTWTTGRLRCYLSPSLDLELCVFINGSMPSHSVHVDFLTLLALHMIRIKRGSLSLRECCAASQWSFFLYCFVVLFISFCWLSVVPELQTQWCPLPGHHMCMGDPPYMMYVLPHRLM